MELHKHLFSVSELNNVIKDVLENSFSSIKIEGEISNFRPASSGHWYFSLKDNYSSISIVMFRNSQYNLNFTPKDGMKVKIQGKLSIYIQRGSYQIICNKMELFGEGDILLMLEERKRKLASLGYFDSSNKKAIPRIPEKICIVTSPTGAAIQDILKVLNRRHTLSEIIILPTPVQGDIAGVTIAKQIDKINRQKLGDLIIVSRGGGSVEDLLPFSDEVVIKAIYNSEIPVISGVGHEIDISLSDLAADIRAATPSAAAEIASEITDKLYNNIIQYKEGMISNINFKIRNYRDKLLIFKPDYVQRVLQSTIDTKRIYIDNLNKNIIDNQNLKLERLNNSIKNYKSLLENLSPLKLFDKGYSWVSLKGKSIKDCNINNGDLLETYYKNGKIYSEVKKNEI